MQAKNETPVGIDLGTTFSVIAHLDSTGRPWTIPNAEGDILTPSTVFFDGKNVIVGKEAIKAAVVEPQDIAQFMKREMGSMVYGKPVHGEYFPPEVIQSFILDKLRRDAALKLGEFRKVVITVPAFFNEPRRKATQDAGALAGLEVIDIINEPTAAAIAFGVQQGFLSTKGEALKREKILVYDLGGGTFDVTLMEIDGRHYNAVATAGDIYLGGIDWDRRIVNYVADQFVQKSKNIDPREHPAGLQRLLREAEDAKRTLSTREQANITFEHAGNAVQITLTRQQFEDMTADLLDRTRFTVVNLMQETGTKWEDITRLIMVGGLSRMPMVQRMLQQVSGKQPDRSLSADESVAHGAAIYAGLVLSAERGVRPKFSVRNVNSHNLGALGIERSTGLTRNHIMIPRNTPLPAKKTSRFVTHRANQSAVAVNVVEGGDASGNDATNIGLCVVRGLPKDLPAQTPVDVTFIYGKDGRLTVKATLPDIKKEATSEIQRASGMTPEVMQSWNQRCKLWLAPPVPAVDQTELQAIFTPPPDAPPAPQSEAPFAPLPEVPSTESQSAEIVKETLSAETVQQSRPDADQPKKSAPSKQVQDDDFIWDEIYGQFVDVTNAKVLSTNTGPVVPPPLDRPAPHSKDQQSSDSNLGSMLTFNGAQLFYKYPMTESEVNRLGKFLVDIEEFNGEAKKTQIRKSGGMYKFRIAVEQGRGQDADTIQNYKTLARQISRRVFNSAEMEIHLCDENFNTIRVIVPYGK